MHFRRKYGNPLLCLLTGVNGMPFLYLGFPNVLVHKMYFENPKVIAL